ncbi:response regulator transcription factor [Pyxidicoccus xibeiensis]|uniref:response regulator transcription factor n=1 Tax=Pyxidicoccus xibeiensis TaxID=2906759 RepID=UPI0020A70DBA|nr:response regulator [Pyxidicoccus xibeiensis]MCP3142443.1 response regulator [Pyxidicoccus xibeiensis]
MRRILIIEDEDILAATLCEILQDEGYEAFTARDGQDGLRLLAERAPDLVLLDLMMPLMDGRGFLMARALDARAQRIPVVVMSSASRSVLQGHAVAGFLAKPFKLEVLLDVISVTLSKAEPEKQRGG